MIKPDAAVSAFAAAAAGAQPPVASSPAESPADSAPRPQSAARPTDDTTSSATSAAVASATSQAQTAHVVEVADPIFSLRGLTVHYGDSLALSDATLDIARNEITAIIGPSGCGKSTFIRCLNRMNDLIPDARVSGEVLFQAQDLYGDDVDPVEVRRRIGMVFQKPNPFPRSIYDNIAFGPRLMGVRKGMDEIVESSLHQAALWDEVRHNLKGSALALSGGQQQRLCIARALAVQPEVILMDEPASALDPISTAKIEDLMQQLVADYTIVIVTHNMQQAARVSNRTAFFTTSVPREGERFGILVEYDDTKTIFTRPADERTEGYITGRFG